MQGAQRKAAIAAYKEQKVAGGIFVVRNVAGGRAWIGAAPNIATIKTRLWFELRQDGASNKALQTEWNAAGPEAFAFEVLETFGGDTAPYPQGAALRQRLDHWQAELGAEAI